MVLILKPSDVFAILDSLNRGIVEKKEVEKLEEVKKTIMRQMEEEYENVYE